MMYLRLGVKQTLFECETIENSVIRIYTTIKILPIDSPYDIAKLNERKYTLMSLTKD